MSGLLALRAARVSESRWVKDPDIFLNGFDFIRENLNRKPARCSHEIWDFPVNFPLNQSIDFPDDLADVFKVKNNSCVGNYEYIYIRIIE